MRPTGPRRPPGVDRAADAGRGVVAGRSADDSAPRQRRRQWDDHVARATASPGADGTVTLRDGRALAYAELGDLSGRPVVLLHGMPGSRLLCPDEDATRAAGVRLITMDRPGYGGSDPRPGRTVLDWVDDYAEFADLPIASSAWAS